MIGCKIKLIPNTLRKASSIYKCNLTVHVGLRDNVGAPNSPMTCLRVGGSSHSLPGKSVSRPKKHALKQQLSALILYHVDEIGIDVLKHK